MKESFVLEELSDESLDAVLSLPMPAKNKYFAAMVRSFYPHLEEQSKDFEELMATYLSSFYVEKLYRCNMFFNEKFTPIYTSTGLIRNIIADMYLLDKETVVH